MFNNDYIKQKAIYFFNTEIFKKNTFVKLKSLKDGVITYCFVKHVNPNVIILCNGYTENFRLLPNALMSENNAEPLYSLEIIELDK